MSEIIAAVLSFVISLHATFDTSTTAVVSWEQPPNISHTCLHRYYGAEYPAAICWRDLPAGPMRVDLPGIYDRRFYWPAHGDRYVLSFDGVDVGTTTLGEVPSVYTTYLPGIMTNAPPQAERVYLSTILR